MARPVQKRVVQQPPRVKGFYPMGYYSKHHGVERLKLEEYESVRLLDYEGLSQEDAAILMHVSRPTLTRIYESARKKISKALTQAHKIVIEGGDFIFHGQWYLCGNCKCKFNAPLNQSLLHCPVCNSEQITGAE